MTQQIVKIPRQPQEQIFTLIDKALEAASQLDVMSQKELDRIIKEMALAGVDNHIRLAELAVEETEMGVYEDKITKNLFATENVYHDIKDKKQRELSIRIQLPEL